MQEALERLVESLCGFKIVFGILWEVIESLSNLVKLVHHALDLSLLAVFKSFLILTMSLNMRHN